MSDGAPPGRPSGAAIAVLDGVAVIAAVVVGLVLAGQEADAPAAGPTPAPTVIVGFPTPASPPGDEGDGEPVEEDETQDPTEDDAAAFTSRYEPPGGRDVQTVTTDLTGDDRDEVAVVSISADLVRLDVAAWTGSEYEVVFTDQGGRADEIAEFLTRDITGDGQPEIVTVQRAGEQGESLSVWGWDGEAFTRQSAVGGCWDGSHTYGIIGAEIVTAGPQTPGPTEIRATCDDSPLPPAAWSTDVYRWDDGAWRHDRTEEQ